MAVCTAMEQVQLTMWWRPPERNGFPFCGICTVHNNKNSTLQDVFIIVSDSSMFFKPLRQRVREISENSAWEVDICLERTEGRTLFDVPPSLEFKILSRDFIATYNIEIMSAAHFVNLLPDLPCIEGYCFHRCNGLRAGDVGSGKSEGINAMLTAFSNHIIGISSVKQSDTESIDLNQFKITSNDYLTDMLTTGDQYKKLANSHLLDVILKQHMPVGSEIISIPERKNGLQSFPNFFKKLDDLSLAMHYIIITIDIATLEDSNKLATNLELIDSLRKKGHNPIIQFTFLDKEKNISVLEKKIKDLTWKLHLQDRDVVFGSFYVGYTTSKSNIIDIQNLKLLAMGRERMRNYITNILYKNPALLVDYKNEIWKERMVTACCIAWLLGLVIIIKKWPAVYCFISQDFRNKKLIKTPSFILQENITNVVVKPTNFVSKQMYPRVCINPQEFEAYESKDNPSLEPSSTKPEVPRDAFSRYIQNHLKH
jgi:hypothetical protein